MKISDEIQNSLPRFKDCKRLNIGSRIERNDLDDIL